LRPKASVAYPNGVEPEIHVDGHLSLPFDGKMSRGAFELLNKAIGKRTIPLRVDAFALDRAADAHRRIAEGHVVGKIVLRIRG
jgi:NADPH:quinone reductase